MSSLKWLDRIILVALSALLIFSAIDKVLHYEGFLNALRDYVLVPPGSAELLGMPVILLELFLGVAMWIPAWRRFAFAASGVLFLIFTVMIGANLLYGNRGVCGCWFTITLAKTAELHILQNLLFAAMAFMVFSDLPKSAPATASTGEAT